MYVVTFYSFKGGVGRTYALVNVGVELARTGRKVLLVDFDLEAPGIPTFDLLRPPRLCPGVVEYTTEYVRQRSAPDVREYLYEVPGLGEEGGRLWVMPAGAGDDQFHQHLAAIDWQDLYRDAEGYLMIEDLKAQWQEVLQPDYVLIDSRTGFTDVQGICTRQLPDAVVLMFFPNDQNLTGLKPVVNDIRSETSRTRGSPIHLHFVASNVPHVDDEDQIVEERLGLFGRTLGFRSPDAVIYRYDSLLLLKQIVFVHERPNSRPARQYRELKDRIIASNFEDREASLRYLRRMVRPHSLSRSAPRASRFGDRLGAILEKHSEDAEVLYLLSVLWRQEGRFEDALALLNRSLERGGRSFRVLLARAELLLEIGRNEEARQSILEVLALPALTVIELGRLVRLCTTAGTAGEGRTLLAALGQSRAFQGLDPGGKLAVVRAFQESHEGLGVAVDTLRPLLADRKVSVEEHSEIQSALVASLIGLGRFSEARQTISAGEPDPAALAPELAFHYGMAEWGECGQAPQTYFRRALQDEDRDKKSASSDPGYYQRRAIAHAVLGEREQAHRHIREAMNAEEYLRRGFNYWRYRMTSITEFLEDCREIKRAIEGEEIRPGIFSPAA